MNLYELTEQYDEVMSLLYDGETDEQTILDTLESIDGEIEDKADNYAKIIKNMLGEAEAVKREKHRSPCQTRMRSANCCRAGKSSGPSSSRTARISISGDGHGREKQDCRACGLYPRPPS